MFKLFVLAALLAVAVAKPGVASVAYHTPLAYNVPLAYNSFAYGAPVAYNAHFAAPYAYAAHHIAAPVAYTAPTTYTTGAIVKVESEPVEHHGYRISY